MSDAAPRRGSALRSAAHVRICRTVGDLVRATAFYRDALGLCVTDKATLAGDAWSALTGVAGARGASVAMRLGAQDLELVAFDPRGDPYPPESSSADLWFQHIAIVVSDIDAAYSRLRVYSFTPISEHGPQQLPPASGSVVAYRFRDPDGVTRSNWSSFRPETQMPYGGRRGQSCWASTTRQFPGTWQSY